MQQHYSTIAMPSPGLPSPTLTNPDMILPYDGDYSLHDTTSSSQLQPTRPPSPPRRASAGLSSHPPFAKLASPPSPPPLSSTDHGSISFHSISQKSDNTDGRALSVINEIETSPKGRRAGNDLLNSYPIASSPTLADPSRNRTYRDADRADFERKHLLRSSYAQMGATSDKGLSDEAIEDDSDMDSAIFEVEGSDDDDDPAELESVKMLRNARLKYHGGVNGAIPEESQDPYLSTALSNRAEKILANAKKRLDNMEGNLSRARHSLIISSSPLMTTSSGNSPSSPNPSKTTSRQTSERRIHPALGVSPAKHRQLNVKTSPSGSGHSRVFSETSIPSTLNTTPESVKKNKGGERSISAFDSTNPIKPMGSGLSPAAAAVLKGIQREEREEANRREMASTVRPQQLARVSPPAHTPQLDSLDEEKSASVPFRQLTTSTSLHNMYASDGIDQSNGLSRSRSTAQMRDLRVQMNDLKGKISTLQQRAREEGMKRRSLQSLRTPSPFTAAEQWYTAPNGGKLEAPRYQVTSDAHLNEHADEDQTLPAGSNTEDKDNKAVDVADTESIAQSYYHDAEEEAKHDSSSDSTDDAMEREMTAERLTSANDPTDHRSKEDRNDELEALYEDRIDLEDESGVAGDRHEDRADAFDYQNFFLHSSMGNYSQAERAKRDSYSSNGSVLTARGINTNDSKRDSSRKAPAYSPAGHQRNMSTDSVSTVATFATATEGYSSELEVSESPSAMTAHLPNLGIPSGSSSRQASNLPSLSHGNQPSTAVKINSALTISTPIASYQPDVGETTPTTRSFPLINRPKSSASSQTDSSIFVSHFTGERYSPSLPASSASSLVASRLLPPPDRALVEKIFENLHDVCSRLKSEPMDASELRERLVNAQKALEGMK